MATDISSIQKAIAQRFAKLGDATNFDVQLTLNEVAAKFNEYTPTADLELSNNQDISLSGLTEGDVLTYNGQTNSFENRRPALIPGKGSTAIWMAPTSGTTPSLFAFGNTVSGTPSFVGANGATAAGAGHSIAYATAASVDAVAGTRHGVLQVSLGQGFEYEARITANANTSSGHRVFVGLLGVTTQPTGDVDIASLTNIIGVGTNGEASPSLKLYYNDGSGTATTNTAAFGTKIFTSLKSYIINIKSLSSTSARVTVTDVDDFSVLSTDITTNLPAATQLLSPIIYISAGTSGAAFAVTVKRQTLFTPY